MLNHFLSPIADEKTRQMIGNRHDLEDTISLSSLPRFGSQRKKKLAPDSLSLVNEPGFSIQGTLTKNNPLSSSLQDFNQTGKYIAHVFTASIH